MCVNIDVRCYSVWSCTRESLRRISVSFNDAVRKIFHYNIGISESSFEGFGMVSIDFYLIRANKLLLLFNCMLSERSIVKVCSYINAYQEDVIDKCKEICVSGSCKNEIKDGIRRVYVDKVGW